jgi:hypothetical protein
MDWYRILVRGSPYLTLLDQPPWNNSGEWSELEFNRVVHFQIVNEPDNLK